MMRTRVGFHLSHEQHSPRALLDIAARAEQAGFSAAMCSDHFHPWSERQGHSGSTWSWLGSALERTRMSFGTVCAPGQRYHPAIVAQAAATLAQMYPERLWVAVGSGEALNERITGQPWPSKADRNARLRMCADVMRALWAGETVTVQGPITTVEARLYDRPSRSPLLLGAALTPETSRWLATWADGMITAAGPRDDMRRILDAFREGGGESKPVFLQVALSFAGSDDESAAAAYDQWRFCAAATEQLADLESPAAFDAATDRAPLDTILSKVRVSADIDRQIAWIQEDLEMGFDRIYLHNVAREHQSRFLDAYGERLPALE